MPERAERPAEKWVCTFEDVARAQLLDFAALSIDGKLDALDEMDWFVREMQDARRRRQEESPPAEA